MAFQCVCSVAQLCLTRCNPKDCSLPGSSVHGILQARILEWVAISSSRGSGRLRDRMHISCVSCISSSEIHGGPTTREFFFPSSIIMEGHKLVRVENDNSAGKSRGGEWVIDEDFSWVLKDEQKFPGEWLAWEELEMKIRVKIQEGSTCTAKAGSRRELPEQTACWNRPRPPEKVLSSVGRWPELNFLSILSPQGEVDVVFSYEAINSP